MRETISYEWEYQPTVGRFDSHIPNPDHVISNQDQMLANLRRERRAYEKVLNDMGASLGFRDAIPQMLIAARKMIDEGTCRD